MKTMLPMLLLACASVAQIPLDTQQSRCDLQVRVVDQAGVEIPTARGEFFSPFGVLIDVKADQHGVLYCGARDSQLSVFPYGSDLVFLVHADGYASQKVFFTLPPVLGCTTCGQGDVKLVESLDVALELAGVSLLQAGGPTTADQPATAPTDDASNPPMCQYEERFVRAYSALCHESTSNFASVSYVNGVCASPLDWSNTTANKQTYTATWSSNLTAEASSSIEKVLSGKLKSTLSTGGSREWSYDQTVTFQGKLGSKNLPGMCGYACMNTTQRVIVTERWIRCCARQNGWGCLEWGDWRRDPRYQPIETRVNTGYCTTEMRLYPCNNPPPVIPSCAQ